MAQVLSPVIYKLHAGSFKNDAGGVYKLGWGLSLKFKVWSVEILQKAGKV